MHHPMENMHPLLADEARSAPGMEYLKLLITFSIMNDSGSGGGIVFLAGACFIRTRKRTTKKNERKRWLVI